MFESCLERQKAVKDLFTDCRTLDERYQRIIDLGKTQKPLAPQDKTEENFVQGCQSLMYMKTICTEGRVYFETESDAIISAGLGILLVKVYSGEEPETILKCQPTYLDELNIRASLTPGRANGLASLYLRMKQEALKVYMRMHKDT